MTWIPKTGEYAMKGDSTVYLSERSHADSFSVEYVTESGDSGGASFWWAPSHFLPVTDPIRLASCKIHAAKMGLKSADIRTQQLREDVRVWSSVIVVLRELAGR